MFPVGNKFGFADIYTQDDILVEGNKIFIYNTACLTIQTEVLGWANAYSRFITTNPLEANIIINLGCQVTDLAVLNDILTLRKLKNIFGKTKQYFMGGCVAQRFDIPLEDKRMDLLYKDYAPITDTSLITWQRPFWVDKLSSNADGRFLRQHDNINFEYLRLGKGCHGNCKYCTIRVTRQKPSILNVDNLLSQIKPRQIMFGGNVTSDPNRVVVAIADTLNSTHIEQLFNYSQSLNVKFALRNIEPVVAMESYDVLMKFAKSGNLYAAHIPIQSSDPEILELMNREVEPTLASMELIKLLKASGVYTATNLIIGMTPTNHSYDVYDICDHVAVNPYWDGKWDYDNAVERMKKFIPFYFINKEK